MIKSKVAPIIQAIFGLGKKRENQNEKLIRKMNEYAEKEKTKQQESKVYGQKPVKERGRNKKTRVYNS